METTVEEIIVRLRQEVRDRQPKLKNGKDRKLSEEVENNIYMRARGILEGYIAAMEHRNTHGEDDAKEAGRKQGMCRGVALAIAEILRGNSPREVWEAAGMSLEECREMEVDDYDMEVLEKEYGDKEETEEEDADE